MHYNSITDQNFYRLFYYRQKPEGRKRPKREKKVKERTHLFRVEGSARDLMRQRWSGVTKKVKSQSVIIRPIFTMGGKPKNIFLSLLVVT